MEMAVLAGNDRGDRSGRGLLIRRSWVRAPPPEPLDTCWVGPWWADQPCC